MKCKYCGKKGVKLSHFPKQHGALMARKSAAGRRKRKLVPKAPHHRGARKESVRSFAEHHTAEIAAAVKAFPGHFCPACGYDVLHGGSCR